jgi:hypothetical protein
MYIVYIGGFENQIIGGLRQFEVELCPDCVRDFLGRLAIAPVVEDSFRRW